MAEARAGTSLLSPVVGALRPGPGSVGRDLDEALRAVEIALASGQSFESVLMPLQRDALRTVTTMRPGGLSALSAAALLPRDIASFANLQPSAATPVVTAPPAKPAQGEATQAALRSTPLAVSLSPLAPDWARGLAPAHAYGPFLNQFGETYWIDIFQAVRLVSLVWSPGPLQTPRLLALLPVRAGAPSARGTLRLAAGSAWLPSRLLVPGRPVNEFIGVNITGGSLALTGQAQQQAQTIAVSGEWQARLQLNLKSPTAPAPAPGIGADATNAQVDLPAALTVAFGSGGLTSTALSDSRLSAYGTSATLKRSQAPPFYDETTRSIVVPCEASVASFAFAQAQSTLFGCGPSAALTSAGWAMPTTITTPDKLGQASGAGYLWLRLGKGLQGKWTALPSPVPFAEATLQLAPGTIAMTIAATDPVAQSLSLWNETAPSPRRSSVDFAAPVGSTIFYVCQAASEGVLVLGRAVAHLDRPVAADGGRLAIAMPTAALALVQTPAEIRVYLCGTDPGAVERPPLALALENLLLTVWSPALFWLSGPLIGANLDSGALTLRFQALSLLPTLPDPYAASFETTAFGASNRTAIGSVTAAVAWADPASATMEFQITTGAAAAPAGASLSMSNREVQQLFMLDLSSNADQLGVAIPVPTFSELAVDGLALVAPASGLRIFTLPPISWEPMLTKQPDSGLDAILPPPPNDGGPAELTADTVVLVPVAPTPLLAEYVDAVSKRRNFWARLPLAFGIIANIDTTRPGAARGAPSDFITSGGVFDNHRPAFVGLQGGSQLRMRAPDSAIAGMSRHFPPPSDTETEDTNGYAAGVLSQNLYTRWVGDFGPKGVPVEQYELSGYGASMFSDWRDKTAVGPAITQARFDVLVGRTSHTVIQMQSTLYPWCVKVVRIITIQRTNGGWVLREDSGWLPASDGLFHFPTSKDLPMGITLMPSIDPAFDDALGQIHRGPVRGVVNIRNIRLSGPQFPVPAGAQTIFQPVAFDADVLIDPAVRVSAGGGPATADGTPVPSRGIDGYIHISGQMKTYTQIGGSGGSGPAVAPASTAEIFLLLAARGPAVAPVACTVRIGGVAGAPGMSIRASQAAVSCDDNAAAPNLVATLCGTPVLPRDGAWSLGRMRATDTAPIALDAQFVAPLVRPAPGAGGSDKWHIADPGDIRRLADADTPKTIYGLLQSAGTQKTFFARPQAIDGVSQIKVPKPPSFADVAALFNAKGIFPNLGDAFDFDTLSALDVTGGDIGFDKSFTIKKVAGKLRETLLMNLGIVEIILRYGDEKGQETTVHVAVTPAASPRWTISMKRVGFAVNYKGGDLIKLFADVAADEKSTPTFGNLNVQYVGFLEILQKIFANIQQLARFLPGGAGAGLRVGFAQGRLTIRNDFALPNLPLGTGQITDVAVAMGLALQLSPLGVEFVAGIGSSQKPFRWVVSPLAGTGVIQVGVNNKGLNILIQGGLGLGLAIDLGIAAGSAAIALAAEINTGVDPFELKAILSGRASVDVLRGLASATITLAAGLGIIPPANLLALPIPPDFPKQLGPYTIGFVASVSVGIHISICWVVDVDWDDYWQFRQDITTPPVPLPF